MARKKTQKRTSLIQSFGPLTLKRCNTSDHGYQYSFFMVEGVDGTGTRIRRKFKNEEEARSFATANVERIANRKELKKAISTDLEAEQIAQAENAFRRLRGRYSLDEVVEYFLRHFKAPETEIMLTEARRKFLDGKEREGLRERSIYQLERTLAQFAEFMERTMASSESGPRECMVHEISTGDIETFLGSLKSKDGIHRAKFSTWNGYRADLSSFFAWCSDKKRRWCSENPVTNTTRYAHKLVHQQRPEPDVLTPEQAEALLAYATTFKGGAYVRYFALLLFAGLRPTEALKLARHEKRHELIDLECGEIELPAEITKTGRKRTIKIQPNLKKWLVAFPGEVLPEKNIDRDLKHLRREFKLTHDVCRHSWFTYFVAKFDSFAKAAKEGGNSEQIVKEHYESPAKKRGEQARKYWNLTPLPVIQTKIIPFEKSA
ncbi:MAG: phage integrase N-terminal SAM-like domain-containing protein [Verrucomicrobiaceae bacterium]|nr:phage integrase N-terminal SAM-like domain-containing protein [Verrucomicrobiaceae bacterium]